MVQSTEGILNAMTTLPLEQEQRRTVARDASETAKPVVEAACEVVAADKTLAAA
jgi:hypothetical protein